MSDLISRKAVIDKAITVPIAKIVTEDKVIYRRIVFVEDIENLPSAQSEIIRCENCEHIRKWRSEESAKKFGQVYECVKKVLGCPKPEDFCSKAERRNDERFNQQTGS